MLETLNIGGVPEHFNRPWLRLLERGALAAAGIDLRWREFPDGSGAMAAALTRGDVDAALLLTEGAVAAIAQGGRFAIASLYTESPLVWGVHVPARSRLAVVGDIKGATYAISRLGSGSHLMCFVHAKQLGWPVRDLRFATVGSLQGAIEAFSAGTAEVFFWEKFMTQPAVDAGHFRRIAEFAAPWPAFVFCVAAATSPAKRVALATALDGALAEARRLASDPEAPREIARCYGLEPDAARAWLGATRWVQRRGITLDAVAGAADALRELGLIARDFDARQLIAPLDEK
jgi:ABC-type nitrate/sulfonate/bicarbonate transport system substrate-binding protein